LYPGSFKEIIGLKSFDYAAVQSVSEAASLLGAHPHAQLLAGGTDLLPSMRQKLFTPGHLMDMRALGELHLRSVLERMATHADEMEPPSLVRRRPLARPLPV